MERLPGHPSTQVRLRLGGEGVICGDFAIRTSPLGTKYEDTQRLIFIVPDSLHVLYGENVNQTPRSDRQRATTVSIIGISRRDASRIKVGEASHISATFDEEGVIVDIQTLDPDMRIERLDPLEDHKLRLVRYLAEQGVLDRQS